MKSIPVYCDAEANPNYAAQFQSLAAMVDKGITLVYGGGHSGLVGAIANEVLSLSSQFVEIIREFLDTKE